jgi:hypothetical protein
MGPQGREDRRGRMHPSGEKDTGMSPDRLRQSAGRVHRSAGRAGPCALIDARLDPRAAAIHDEGHSPRGPRTPHPREGIRPIGPKGHRFARAGLGIRREGLPLALGERVNGTITALVSPPAMYRRQCQSLHGAQAAPWRRPRLADAHGNIECFRIRTPRPPTDALPLSARLPRARPGHDRGARWTASPAKSSLSVLAG